MRYIARHSLYYNLSFPLHQQATCSYASLSAKIMTKLTEDIAMDILSRLPVKTLLRFKCVSKGWHAMISNPHFTKMHLQRVIGENWVSSQRIIKTDPLQSLNYEALEDAEYDETAVECYHGLEFDSDWCSGLIGSCNGLICLQQENDAMVVLNPCTRQFRILPGSGSDIGNQMEFFHGLGYDPVADDYKLVRGSHMHSVNGDMESYIEIYSLKSSSWRTIRRDGNFRVYARGIYLNGALHWFGSTVDKENAIVAFDIVEEKFKEVVATPDGDENLCPGDIGVHGGRLCVLNGSWDYQFEAWLMNEYGRHESWKLWYSVSRDGVPGHKYGSTAVACTSNGKLVVDVSGYYMILYNPEDGKYWKIPVDEGDPFEYAIYVETLVSPHTCAEPSGLHASSGTRREHPRRTSYAAPY